MPKNSDFPSDEYETRCKKVQELMKGRDLDALFLSGIENVTYFSGYRRTQVGKRRGYYLILPREGRPTLILPEREKNKAEDMSWLYPDGVRFFSGLYSKKEEDPNEVVVETIEKLRAEKGKIGMELDNPRMRVDMSLADYEAVKNKLGQAKLVDAGEIIWQVRMIKSPREIECLRKSCEITYEAFRVALESIKEGVTELDIAKTVYLEMVKGGCVDDPLKVFVHIRSGPERYSTPDPRPTNRKVMKGDIVSLDGGAFYKGYYTDMIRLGCIEPSRKQQEMFDVTVKACEKGVEMLVPGTKIRDVVSIPLDLIKKAGYEKYITFTVVGHGVGLDTHEPPILDFPYGDKLIEEGMVLAMEPAFLTNEGSFVQEDNVVVTRKGPENLTPLKKTLQW